MSLSRIAVLGGGNGGHALAAELSLKGCDVSLFEFPAFSQNIEETKKAGGVWLKGVLGEGFAPLSLVTTSVQEAVENRGIVFIVAPAFAVEKFADILAFVLQPEQMVVFVASSSLASWRFCRRIEELGGSCNFKIGETATLTYACRLLEPGIVHVYLSVKEVLFSAFPAKYTEDMLNVLRPLFPSFKPASSILETCLQNANPATHPTPTVLSAGRIEYSGGDFYLYKEGITPSVAKVMLRVDAERMALCESLGFRGINIKEGAVIRGYCESTEQVHSQYNESKIFASIKGPSLLDSRYITEDVPYGLVIWSSLGKALNIPTPTIDAIIHIASTLLDRDFYVEGITMDKLGLPEGSKKELLEILL